MPVGVVLHRKDFKTICESLRASKKTAARELEKRLGCERVLPREVGEPPTRREVVTQPPLPTPEGLVPAKRD